MIFKCLSQNWGAFSLSRVNVSVNNYDVYNFYNVRINFRIILVHIFFLFFLQETFQIVTQHLSIYSIYSGRRSVGPS